MNDMSEGYSSGNGEDDSENSDIIINQESKEMGEEGNGGVKNQIENKKKDQMKLQQSTKKDDDEKKKKLKERKGDWTCAKCGNLNFSFRIICNRCQLPKKDSDIINTPMSLPFNDNMMCHYSMNFVNNGQIYCNNMNVLNQNRGNNIGGELSENVNE